MAGGIDVDLPGDRVRLRGTRWPGAGTPVLLLHGLASQRRFWNLVLPHLVGGPGGLHVVALDQRGHGDSARPADGYDTPTVARDALAALDALGLSRTVLVGHSWGASVALQLAADAPGRALAVVALDGGTTSLAGLGDRATLRRSLQPPRTSAAPEELVQLLRAGPLARWWSAQVERAVLPLFELGADGLATPRLPFELHMRAVDGLLDYDAAAVLSRVRCPTWLVCCEPVTDELGPAAGESPVTGPDGPWATARVAGLHAAAVALAQPRLMRWAGAVHDVPLQWPALVAGLIQAAAAEVAGGERVHTQGGRPGE